MPRAAASTSPRSSARRIAEDETTSARPSIGASTFSTISTAKPSRAPARTRSIGRAGAPATEVEVPADHDRADVEPRHQRLFDEFLRRQAGERRVEGQRRRAGEAERAEDVRLDRQRRQAKDDRPAGEIVGRMRLEGEDGGGRAPFGGERQGAGDDRGVAAVDAVEIADRVDRSFESGRRPRRVDRQREGSRRGLNQGCIRRRGATLV